MSVQNCPLSAKCAVLPPKSWIRLCPRLLRLMGPPVPMTARVHSTPQGNITSFYGSSYANDGKGALNTPSFPSPFLALCPVPHFLPPLSHFRPC
eukprot:1196237-Prorocentrum_minimum.AAC.4